MSRLGPFFWHNGYYLHDMRIPFEDLKDELRRVLLAKGFSPERADRCATLFAETSRDGVYSHGLNRFPRFIKMIDRGTIDVEAEPTRVASFGVLERWDGHLGPGNLNADICMARTIALAQEHGMACVALRNTNHWMRGGTYGWQAAQAGLIGICWTNTNQNLPPWGAREPRIGNNPLIIAVPRANGHVVLDMAMSQFSYGALTSYQLKGNALPVPGGYDAEGNLSQDPAAIEAAGRPLPIGYWKGSGLSILLDMVGALLAAGQPTHTIPNDPLLESGLTQVFLAFDVQRLYPEGGADALIDEIVAHLHASEPAEEADRVYYPGERTLMTRLENLEYGIPVDPGIWEQVSAM